MAAVACCLALFPGVIAVLLSCPSVDSRIETAARCRVPAGGALLGLDDQCLAICRRGISVAAGVEAVYGRLLVTRRWVPCFREAISPLSGPVPDVRRLDEPPHPLTAFVRDAIPLISDPVTIVRRGIAFVRDPIPLIRDALALFRHADVPLPFRFRPRHSLARCMFPTMIRR